MGAHFVTGGTGFVGSAILLELFQRTDETIYCLVRPTRTQTADERLHTSLLAAAHAYGYDCQRITRIVQTQCRTLTGSLADCESLAGELPYIDQFWHCAASIRYEDRYQQEIQETNVIGTQRAAYLARRLHAANFNYISTAYVAGSRTGVIAEKALAELQTNNHYETSKFQAETFLLSLSDLPLRILRPSIVIGHSRTFAAAINFSGMYGFIRRMLQFKAAMERVQEGLLSKETLQMRVDADAALNLVPIDQVARQAVQIAFSSSAQRFYHLTNATPTTTAAFLLLLFQELGVKSPCLVKNRETFSWIDQKLDQSLVFYRSYLVGSKTFDRTNTDAAIGSAGEGSLSLDSSTLRAYFHWYLQQLGAKRPRLLATR